jgi:hypothetical protein
MILGDWGKVTTVESLVGKNRRAVKDREPRDPSLHSG